jgi:hypothetical protein
MIGLRRHPSLVRLSGYADRKDAGKRLVSHLAECPTCRGEVAALRSVEAALHELPTPTPSPALRSRVLAARAAGTRAILPANSRARKLFRWPFVLTAAAAALVAGIALSLFQTGSDDTNSTATSFFLSPSVAFAQQVAQAPQPMKYEPLNQLDAKQLAPGRWTYQAAVIIDATLETDRSRRTLMLARGMYKGRSTWQVANEWEFENPLWLGSYVDTILVDGSTLQPIRRAVDRPRFSQLQEFTSDSVFGTDLVKATPRFSSLTVKGAAPLRHPTVDWMTLKPLLQAAALHAGWRGSVYVMFMQPRRDSVYFPSFTLDMRVVGQERVMVPAGSFDCWKILANVPAVGIVSPGYHARPSEIWVSRDHQWVIQIRDRFSDDMVFQEQLLQHGESPASPGQ